MENAPIALKLVQFSFRVLGLASDSNRRPWFILIPILGFTTYFAIVICFAYRRQSNQETFMEQAVFCLRHCVTVYFVSMQIYNNDNLINKCNYVLREFFENQTELNLEYYLLSCVLLLLSMFSITLLPIYITFLTKASFVSYWIDLFLFFLDGYFEAKFGLLVFIATTACTSLFINFLHLALVMLTAESLCIEVVKLSFDIAIGKPVIQVAERHTKLYHTVQELDHYLSGTLFCWLAMWVCVFCVQFAVYIGYSKRYGWSLDTITVYWEIVPFLITLLMLLYVFCILHGSKDFLLAACHCRPKTNQNQANLAKETYLLCKFATAKLQFTFLKMAVVDKRFMQALVTGAVSYLLFMLTVTDHRSCENYVSNASSCSAFCTC